MDLFAGLDDTARMVLEIAQKEAGGRQPLFVTTEDLVAAILIADDPHAASALRDAGVHVEQTGLWDGRRERRPVRRFNLQARQAILAAREHARRRGVRRPAARDLLAGVLDDPASQYRRTLSRCRVSPEQVRVLLDRGDTMI
jgi:ATP-dependent Clp protease ATP-binding subunit ClpA